VEITAHETILGAGKNLQVLAFVCGRGLSRFKVRGVGDWLCADGFSRRVLDATAVRTAGGAGWGGGRMAGGYRQLNRRPCSRVGRR
jgi:hypothetical protein